MKNKVFITLTVIFLVLFIVVLGRLRGTEYVIEEVITEDWMIKGGTIELKGLHREYNIGDLVYIGLDDQELKKITMELKTKSFLGVLPEETLSLSSIGGSESWSIEKGFSYGSLSGTTHSVSVLKSYLLSGLELHVQIDSTTGLDGIVVEIPIN